MSAALTSTAMVAAMADARHAHEIKRARRARLRRLGKLALAIAALLVALLLPALVRADVVCSAPVTSCGGGGGGVSLSGTNAWTGANSFWDTLFTIVDNGDITKKIAFEASLITAGNTRTITVPDASGTLPFLQSAQTFTQVNTFSLDGGAIVLSGTGGFIQMATGGSQAVYFGDSKGGQYGARVEQTPDTMFIGTGTSGNSLIFAENADQTFDFAHAAQTNPTLFIHSATQNTGQWISLHHDTGTGVISTGTRFARVFVFDENMLALQNNSAPRTASVGANTAFAWTTTDDATGTKDTFLTRESAAVVQLGSDLNGTAISQTLKGPDGVTGTDVSGGALTIAPGRGTGTAVGGQVVLQRAQRNATGTAAQPLLTAWISCPVKILSNTSATVQAVATITTTSVSGGSITADFSTTACSATVCNVDAGVQKIAWRNAAGTVTAAVSAVGEQVDADASGTLATTPTATVATNVVTYNFTPTWVTIVPTVVHGYVNFLVNSLNTVVCQ